MRSGVGDNALIAQEVEDWGRNSSNFTLKGLQNQKPSISFLNILMLFIKHFGMFGIYCFMQVCLLDI
jgi:hypothetical protein